MFSVEFINEHSLVFCVVGMVVYFGQFFVFGFLIRNMEKESKSEAIGVGLLLFLCLGWFSALLLTVVPLLVVFVVTVFTVMWWLFCKITKIEFNRGNTE